MNFYLEKIRINEEINISKPIDYCGKTLRSYCLEQGYNYDIVKKYNLTQVESKVLQNSIARYINVMIEYQIVDVGLETKDEKRIKKITKYNLNTEEIEESFFVPLAFDQGVLLGRQSELYKRRQLLRQYIIDWDYYSDEEKDALQSTFTKAELYYINNSRKKINETVKVLRKR